jgi:hypothetical protein
VPVPRRRFDDREDHQLGTAALQLVLRVAAHILCRNIWRGDGPCQRIISYTPRTTPGAPRAPGTPASVCGARCPARSACGPAPSPRTAARAAPTRPDVPSFVRNRHGSTRSTACGHCPPSRLTRRASARRASAAVLTAAVITSDLLHEIDNHRAQSAPDVLMLEHLNASFPRAEARVELTVRATARDRPGCRRAEVERQGERTSCAGLCPCHARSLRGGRDKVGQSRSEARVSPATRRGPKQIPITTCRWRISRSRHTGGDVERRRDPHGRSVHDLHRSGRNDVRRHRKPPRDRHRLGRCQRAWRLRDDQHGDERLPTMSIGRTVRVVVTHAARHHRLHRDATSTGARPGWWTCRRHTA